MPTLAPVAAVRATGSEAAQACNSYSEGESGGGKPQRQISARCRSTTASTTTNAVMLTMRRTVADGVRM
jgi:hypothetical protein